MALAGLGMLGLFVLIALQVPIGIAMAIAGVIGVALFVGPDAALSLFAIETSAALANPSLAVVAIFLLMGSFANAAGLSADLFALANLLLGRHRGGLAAASIAGAAGFGAICGSSVATTATMARIALPQMRARGYSPELSSGALAAGGTLGILIPPSIILVLYGVLTEQSVVALFAAALLPGIAAVAFYLVTVAVYVRLRPGSGPRAAPLTAEERGRILRAAWRVVVVILAVSGGLYTGVFTVTEAAAVGVALALLMGVIAKRMSRRALTDSLLEAAGNTCLIFTIIIGAAIFAYFISLTEAPDQLVGWIRDAGLSPLAIIAILLLVYIVLGAVFDTVASLVITLPFVFPLVTGLGFDPIWWGVLMVMVMEVGLITPPIGINVFVLQGTARDLRLGQIYAGVMPFLIADLGRLALLVLVPGLALWLPGLLGLL